MSAASDRLKQYNTNPYNSATNPRGFAGVGGMDTNWIPALQDVASVGEEASAAAELAVPAAATATNAIPIVTAARDQAVAAALSAAGIIQHVQPSEIAGIDPILDFPFRASTAVPSGVITGSSGKWVTNQAGVLVNVPAGTAPIDYDPITSVVRGLLVEESRTNLLVQSRNFSSTSWGALTGVSATQNAVGPDGVANSAWTIADTSAAGFGERYQDVTVANDTATRLFWVLMKAGTSTRVSLRIEYIGGTGVSGSIDVNPVAGTIASQVGSIYGFTPLYGGYYLAYIALANNGTGNTVCRVHVIPSPVSASDQTTVVVYHAQLEPGTFPTSMIPTTTGTVNRAADVNTVLLSSVPGWNASEGTVYVEFDVVGLRSSGDQNVATIDDGTASNRIGLRVDTGSIQALALNGGAGAVNGHGAAAANTTYKMAVAWATNSVASVVGGGTPVTSSSYTVPSFTTLQLGSQSGGSQLNGHIRRLTLFPRRLSNATLQLLTA